jgi:hypothetical protein
MGQVVVLDITFAESVDSDGDESIEANVGEAPDANTCVLILDRDATVLVGHYPEAQRSPQMTSRSAVYGGWAPPRQY